MFSTVAFYLHTELVLTNRRLHAVRPNVLFGLIPVGTNRSSFPVENIAGVSASTRFDVLGVVFGVVGVLVGLAALAIPAAAPLGLLLIALGVVFVVGAPRQAIEVMNSGGGVIRFPVSVFERGRTVEFANRVAEAVARTSSHVTQPAVLVQSPVSEDAGSSLRRLQTLRDQGLVSEEEFVAKRREILGRL